MRILIAEDDHVSRAVLETNLQTWGFKVESTRDGYEAWAAMQKQHAPKVALLDWMMPGHDGPDICRRVRQLEFRVPPYLILLTARDAKKDIVQGLAAGADDYITKPFNRDELKARVQVGVRMTDLQSSLADRIDELETALSQIQTLEGLLPICSYCKRIRKDDNYWQQVEGYIVEHSAAEFTHGICPDCFEKVLAPQLEHLSQPAG